jgi:hypothetical protein
MDDVPLGNGQPLAAGMPVPAYQARQALKSGASHIIIHVTVVSRMASQICAELRNEGITVSLVRSPGELAGAIHPEEQALIFAPDHMFPMDLVRYVAARDIPVLCVHSAKQGQNNHLIDHAHCWSGLALVPGGLVRKVADLPGEWAMDSALLRLAVQNGSDHLLIEQETAHQVSDQQSVDRALVAMSRVRFAGDKSSGVERLIAAPGKASRSIAFRLFGWGVDRRLPAFFAGLTLILSLVTGWYDSAVSGILVSLGALVLTDIYQAMSEMALRDQIWIYRLKRATVTVIAGQTLLLGFQSWRSSAEWGFLALSFWLLFNVIAFGLHKSELAIASLAAFLGICAAFGQPIVGLIACVVLTGLVGVRSSLVRN